MGTPRQQRAARNRRAVTAANPPLIPALAAVVSAVTSGFLDLQFHALSAPPTDAGTPVPIVLNGVPAIRRTVTTDLPLTATLQPDGLTIRLIYPGGPGLGPDEAFLVGPNDPAIRTATGSFVAQGVIAPLSPITPPITPAAVAGVCVGGNDVDITFTPIAATLCVFEPTLLLIDSGFKTPTVVTLTAPASPGAPVTYRVTYNATPAPGGTLQYSGPQLTSGTPGVCAPDPAPVILT